MARRRGVIADLRGASRLAVEATRGVTDLVRAMHVTIAGGPAILGSPLAGVARAATAPVYGIIHGVTALVGAGIDAALAQLPPLLGEPGTQGGAVLSAVNGVLGDYLVESGNPLAIAMELRPVGEPRARLVVLVHGLCMNDRQWARGGHDHGAALARDLGATAVYAHYNTGLHISTNGRELAAQLEALVAAWPVPVTEIILVGHSMGGLVARSACHAAEAEHAAWRASLRALVMLGSPHHGAPLERGGSWIDLLLGVSRYSAPLGRLARIRSAGITDLRYGAVRDEHWRHVGDRFAPTADARDGTPLPAGVRSFALAATLSPAGTAAPRGDGLVPVDSALGHHADAALALGVPEARRAIAYETGHLDLLGAAVYPTILGWLADA